MIIVLAFSALTLVGRQEEHLAYKIES